MKRNSDAVTPKARSESIMDCKPSAEGGASQRGVSRRSFLGTGVACGTALATGGPRPSDGNGTGGVGVLTRDGTYAMVSRLLAERGELVATANDQGLYRLSSA